MEFGPRMRKQSSPLGETLRWPSGSVGAVPTKNMCCRPMNAAISLVQMIVDLAHYRLAHGT